MVRRLRRGQPSNRGSRPIGCFRCGIRRRARRWRPLEPAPCSLLAGAFHDAGPDRGALNAKPGLSEFRHMFGLGAPSDRTEIGERARVFDSRAGTGPFRALNVRLQPSERRMRPMSERARQAQLKISGCTHGTSVSQVAGLTRSVPLNARPTGRPDGRRTGTALSRTTCKLARSTRADPLGIADAFPTSIVDECPRAPTISRQRPLMRGSSASLKPSPM